jgi:hypothetical protein
MSFQPRPPRTELTHRRRTPLDAATEVSLLFWVIAQRWARAAVTRTTTAARGDRGDALSTAVIAVGMVLLAAGVVAVLKAKSQTIVNHVCTNADPTTC